MKISAYVLLALLPLLAATTDDRCARPADTAQKCKHAAMAKDFSDLDGCSLLLVLDNGKKLLATNLEAFDILWRANEAYRIDYEILEDMMSICMTEDHTVTLTCAELVAAHTNSAKCDTIVDPYRVDWSAKVMQELDPRRVVEMYIDDQLCYFYPGKTERRIYRCTGELLCRSTMDNPDTCRKHMLDADRIRVMYIVND